MFAISAVLTAALLLPQAAQAHRVNIFAWLEDGHVQVECGFSRKSKVNGGIVDVFDAGTGERVLSGTTDANGRFSFPLPAAIRDSGHDMRLVIRAGEGHQNEWLMTAREWKEASAPTQKPSDAPTPALPVPSASGAPAPSSLDRAEIERMINSAVEAKVAPLRRQLAALDTDGPSLKEIIGGIGWILGLVGILAWSRRRR